jgi:CRISPR-associated protein Cas2
MMPDSVHRFLVAYDIVNDLRRGRVAKVLESYGDRIQFSVFLIDVKPAKIVRLRDILRVTVDLNADSVLICELGPAASAGEARLQFIGRERPYMGDGPLIL